MKYLICLWLLLVATHTEGQSIGKETGSRITPEEAGEVLAHHNLVREELGVPPLTWSNELAAFAQEWADHLAANGCKMEHRQQPRINQEAIGENLFWGSNGAVYHPKDASLSWYSEKKIYKYGQFGKGNWHAIGHYTQMVWRKTRQVGVGVAICKEGEILVVANYYPAGNYLGELPY